MSIKIMTAVWASSEQKGAGLLILLALADFANDEGICWPSVDTLAKKARCSRRTVQEVIKALVEMGEVKIDENEGPSGTHLYHVLTGGGAETAPRSIRKVPAKGAIQNVEGAQNSDAKLRPNRKEPSLGTAREPSEEIARPENGRARTPAPIAVEALRKIIHRYPAKAWFPKIAETVGESPDDLARWEQIATDWIGYGFNPVNVKGMLEVFIKGWGDRRKSGKPTGMDVLRQSYAASVARQEESHD